MATFCKTCGTKKGIADMFTADLGSSVFICESCKSKAMVCKLCGGRQGLANISSGGVQTSEFICEDCRVAAYQKKQREEQARLKRIQDASLSVILSTTNSLDGYWVTEYLGIESVEFVIGTGLFSEVTTEIADFFGRRSTAFEQKLASAKKYTLNALEWIAAEKGANAVIAIDLDYTEFSGNRIALIANGTLVKVEKAGG